MGALSRLISCAIRNWEPQKHFVFFAEYFLLLRWVPVASFTMLLRRSFSACTASKTSRLIIASCDCFTINIGCIGSTFRFFIRLLSGKPEEYDLSTITSPIYFSLLSMVSILRLHQRSFPVGDLMPRASSSFRILTTLYPFKYRSKIRRTFSASSGTITSPPSSVRYP